MTCTTIDELDLLLEEYLSLLDTYQSLQISLESSLKSAYFNLAKSKIQLGPHRLSQKGWDLKQKDSFVQVVIQQDSTHSSQRSETTTESTTKENPILNYSIQPRNSSLPSHSTSTPISTPESTLRQRSQPNSSSSSSSSSSPDSPLNPKPSPPLLDSRLNQFSSLPPPSLRSSAKSFETSLEKIVGIVEVEGKLRAMAKRIKGVKKRFRAEEREREGKGEELRGSGSGIEGDGTGGIE